MNTANRRKILSAGKGFKTDNKHQIHSLLGDFNLILAAFTFKFTMTQEHRASWSKALKIPSRQFTFIIWKKKKGYKVIEML